MKIWTKYQITEIKKEKKCASPHHFWQTPVTRNKIFFFWPKGLNEILVSRQQIKKYACFNILFSIFDNKNPRLDTIIATFSWTLWTILKKFKFSIMAALICIFKNNAQGCCEDNPTKNVQRTHGNTNPPKKLALRTFLGPCSGRMDYCVLCTN